MLRRHLKRLSFAAHRLALRAKLFVLPVHYYVPLADVRELERTRDTWARRSELPGLDIDLEAQSRSLRQVCTPYREEYAGNLAYREAVAHRFGPGYGYVEAQALHAVIRFFEPSTILEVGSGVSTYCALKAAEMNERETGKRPHITCIEPHPSPALRRLSDVRLIEEKVQAVSVSTFERLAARDLLFIDSSHNVRPGGDVNFLVLEVLPRLARGVIVHLHDIFLPYDYPRDVLRSYFHWMETSLLRAFLVFNPKSRIVFCLSHLHYERPDVLREVFPGYRPAPDDCGLAPEAGKDEGHFPASIYIEIL